MRTWARLLSVAGLCVFGLQADTWSGTISDEACGAKHTAGSVSDQACVTSCVKAGKAPVVISNGRVYKISADSASKVSPYLGKKVTINGKLQGDTITIESIESAES